MKLLRAHIENFRLLTDVELNFSTDPVRNVTVVRAANDSGKTTVLVALRWALFGDDALPAPDRHEYRLSPIYNAPSRPKPVQVAVQVDYVIGTGAAARRYRLRRSRIETIHNVQWQPGATVVSLFELGPNGAHEVKSPETKIRAHLPPDLREIFFTDGDKALTFIEGDARIQAKQVELAIRSLLGLDLLESALGHVRTVRNRLNKRVREGKSASAELKEVSDAIDGTTKTLPALERELVETREARRRLSDLWTQADRRLSKALRAGNRNDLVAARKDAVRRQKQAFAAAQQAVKDHSKLFREELLARHCLARPFAKARRILDGLRRRGEIPNQTIPVLEDRLSDALCICGETLDASTERGRKHRKHIRALIRQSEGADALRGQATTLYFGARDLLRPIDGRGWPGKYDAVLKRRMYAEGEAEKYGTDVRNIEHRISKLPDVDVVELKRRRDRYGEQRDGAAERAGRLEVHIASRKEELSDLERRRGSLLRQDQEGQRVLADLDVAADLEKVLALGLGKMRTRELGRAAEVMNEAFLEMIGVDPDEDAIIAGVRITEDYRIEVRGRHEHVLDAARDINGASRRALTIAFLLALTRVSEVEAPTVIDTPLGMMSGYVKWAALQVAAKRSAQLVLLLTHSEIVGCEEILDRRVGKACTLTNPAHYPKILVNRPPVRDGVVVCSCHHRGSCSKCERRDKVGGEEAINQAGERS